MSTKPKKPTARERRRAQIGAFCNHLIGAKTLDEACRKTGISSRTGTRWLRSEEFAEVYVEQREATLTSLASMLRASSVAAVEALADVIKDSEAAPTARTAAAKSVLDSLLRITEVEEFERRLARLETVAGAEGDR